MLISQRNMLLGRTQQIKKTNWHKSALLAVCRSNRELESLKKSTDFTMSFGRLLQEVYLSACRTCRTIIVLYLLLYLLLNLYIIIPYNGCVS